ncbi:hypothetical protein G9A89_019614 [Geosiphon pyriformis]|nr:hypothetical protein G9A89_019614 [Geosiphon pyriformis]
MWEVYQISWTDVDYNKLLPILFWDDNNNGKEKQKAELTWETDNLTWTNNNEPTSSWKWEESKESNKGKGKEKEEETTLTNITTYNSHTYPSSPINYCQPKLICVDCDKKLLSMGACCDDDEEYSMYCNECDLIYNPPPHIIYTIPEEEEPINSCASELESTFNPNSNSNNDNDKNNGSSSALNGNKNYDDSNSDSNPETFIALPDFSKEQELKWYSDNNKSIMPECTHDTDAEFDLRYPGKKAIKLEPNSCTCIDLKIALEIPATTMVQLAFRSSLAKKGINIRREIIDTGYVGNIIAMLQNDSEKAYIIEPNEKIAQTIFLPLVKIVQLVLVENREELRITAKEIQGFESTGRIDIPVNMAEEKVIDKREIILTHQSIFIPSYDQYMLLIKRKVKNQAQLFEAEATICKSGEIGLTNLYISAKSPKNIKIPIYNTTGSVIEIPKGTIIGYLTTEVEDQPPNHIPDFSQLCGYVNITSQTIYGQSKYYLFQPEQLEQMNMENLDPL